MRQRAGEEGGSVARHQEGDARARSDERRSTGQNPSASAAHFVAHYGLVGGMHAYFNERHLWRELHERLFRRECGVVGGELGMVTRVGVCVCVGVCA